MKKYLLVFVILIQFFSLFAASVPKWISDVDSEFPKEKYIARLGSGTTVENARSDAVGQIAGFFKSEVVVNTNASSNMQNDGVKTKKNQEIDQHVRVVSDMTLTAVEYNTPYYYKKKKSYYVVAYIEREQGWQVIESQAMQLRSKYESFLELAKKNDEPTMKYKYLTKAKSASEDLLSALYMGFLFDSTKKKEYRNFIAEISQNYDLETLDSYRILVLVESTGDYENTITAKVLEALKQQNFSAVYDGKKDYDALLKVEVSNNEKISDEIHTIYPEVSVSLLSKDGRKVFYSYQNSWGKTASFSLAQAQKKSFPKISEEIKSALEIDFEEKFLMK